MDKKNVFRRGIVATLSMLFIGVAIIPGINGFTLENLSGENKIMDASTQGGYNITVETDRYYYFRGDTVHFSGQLTKNGVGFRGEIQYELRNPHNNPFFGGMMYTENTGFFNITYKLRNNAPLGLYTFKVEYCDDTSVFATASFEVIPSLQIEKITGGLGKLCVGITNVRGENLDNVTWSILVFPFDGFFFLFEDTLTEGTIPLLEANETVSIKTSGFLLGLGELGVYVTANFGKEKTTKSCICNIFFFIIICKA